MNNLNEMGLEELKKSDKVCVTGGGPITFAAWAATVAGGLIIAAGAEIISDWDNFKRGLAGEPEQ